MAEANLTLEYGVPIYSLNIGVESNLIKVCEEFFNTEGSEHALELGGQSSRSFDDGMHLHQFDEFKSLSKIVLTHANNYWTGYGLDTYYEPTIKECWTNRHRKGHKTVSHFHSSSPIVATYYLEAPEDGGRLYFENPLEYHMCHEPRSDFNTRYIDVKPGMLVFFPGWLKHGTEESQTNSARTVISFNFGYENRKPINIST